MSSSVKSFGLEVGLPAHSEGAREAFAQLSVSPWAPQEGAREGGEARSWRAFCFALSAFLVDEDDAAHEVWRDLSTQHSIQREELRAQLWSRYYLTHAAQFEGDVPHFEEMLILLEESLEEGLKTWLVEPAQCDDPAQRGILGDLELLRDLTALKRASLQLAEPEWAAQEGRCEPRGVSLSASGLIGLMSRLEAHKHPLLALEALTYATTLWVREGGLMGAEEAQTLTSSLERLAPLRGCLSADLTLQLSVELSQLELWSEAEAWAEELTARDVPQRVLSMVNLAGIKLMRGALTEAEAWLERAGSFDLNEHPPLVADLWSYNDLLLRSLQGQALSPEAISAAWRPLLSAPFKVTWEGLAYRELEVLLQQGRLEEALSLLDELQGVQANSPRLEWFKYHQEAVIYGWLREGASDEQAEHLSSLERASYQEALELSRRLEPTLQLLSLADTLTLCPLDPEERSWLIDELEELLSSPHPSLTQGLFAGVAALWRARLSDEPQAREAHYQQALRVYEESSALWDLAMLLMESGEVAPQRTLRLQRSERSLSICAQLFTWASSERRAQLWAMLCELFEAWRKASAHAPLAELWRPLYTFKASALPPLDPTEVPPAWVERALHRATLRLASEVASSVRLQPSQAAREQRAREHSTRGTNPHARPEIPLSPPELDVLLSRQRPHSLLLDLELSAGEVTCFWSRVDEHEGRQRRGKVSIELSSEVIEGLVSWEVWREEGSRARLERERDLLSWERLLITPLLSALEEEGVAVSAERGRPIELYVSPPHALRHLPLHLSLCPHTGLSLFERFYICWLPSLTSLKPATLSKAHSGVGRVLILRGCESRGELPELDVELARLKGFVDQGDHQLISTFEECPDLVHWGAHGHLDAREGAVITVDGEELTADHLALLISRASRAGAAPLIYLSACDLGAPALGSPPMCDLSARCLAAGARAIISSQWSLPDVVASALSALFYERYLASDRSQTSLYESLYQALSELKAQRLDPIYWGGVRLWGG